MSGFGDGIGGVSFQRVVDRRGGGIYTLTGCSRRDRPE